jgi:CheY-like chemotaxis protein
MPCLDGWGVLRELASHPKTKGIPVIVVTAGDVTTATAHATAILRKPVTPDDVMPLIWRHLDWKRIGINNETRRWEMRVLTNLRSLPLVVAKAAPKRVHQFVRIHGLPQQARKLGFIHIHVTGNDNDGDAIREAQRRHLVIDVSAGDAGQAQVQNDRRRGLAVDNAKSVSSIFRGDDQEPFGSQR